MILSEGVAVEYILDLLRVSIVFVTDSFFLQLTVKAFFAVEALFQQTWKARQRSRRNILLFSGVNLVVYCFEHMPSYSGTCLCLQPTRLVTNFCKDAPMN